MRRLFLASSGAVLFTGMAALVPPSAGAVSPGGTTQGLILQYAFEAAPNGRVDNLAGDALDGTVVASASSTIIAASLAGYGKALQLRGDRHEFVDVPLSPLLDLDRYTISAWVRYTGVQNDATGGRWEVLEKAGAYWMNVRTDGRVRVGGFYGGCSTPAWRYLDSTRALRVSRWYHLATAYDGVRLRVFINGSAAGSKAVTGRTCASAEPAAVGAKNNPSKGLLEAFWDGKLDEIRLYDRALSSSEIAELAVRG